jgi:single-strand DNA-binding protein
MSSFAINTLTIDGNLVSDPELRSLPGGTRICRLRIAHNEQRKDTATGEYTGHAGFYDVTVWAGPGEWVAQNLVKSDRIVVNGRLTYREFEVDGKKRSQIGITAESIVPVKHNSTATEAPPAQDPAKPTRARRSRATT